MFFKGLEISGFKSFARKTLLEFQSGVTIIVGPNGCGKSNIFDAVRWVLGEQSVKSLRAAKMGDVIFNGTSQIKPANFAQVSIVVDNRSSLLPVEVKEIVITRRLFRDGESQYLINKVPCRLKDIHELFMDTGIGTSAYSMMEQGQVDFIINARPQERREIFDEAAGIAKYKARKAETLRKLERTTEDLVRLSDVIAEVKRTLNSLKRQASRTRIYREIKEQMEEIEKILLCRRADHVQQQQTIIDERLIERQDALHQLNAQVAKLEALWRDGQLRLEELQKNVAETQSLVYNIKSDLEQTRQKSVHVQERITEYKQREEGFGTENETITSKARELAEREQNFQDILTKLDNELQHITETMTVHESRMNELMETRHNLDGKARELGSQMASLLEQKQRLSEDIRRHELEHNKFEFQIAEMKKDHGEIEQSILNLENELIQKRDVAGSYDAQIAELTRSIEDTKEKEHHARQNCDALQSRKSALEAELHQLKAEQRMLEQMMQNFEGYSQGVKELMLATRRGETNQTIKALTELIEVQAEFEPAIEAALAEKLQYILVKDLDSALKTIEFLENKKKGLRAVILPESNQRLMPRNGKPFPEDMNIDGVLGKALSFITCNKDAEHIIDALLGDVVVVKDRETALKLASLNQYVYVTRDATFLLGRDGELVVGNGHRTGKLLGRQRQLKEIKTRIDTRDAELQSVLTDVANATKEIELLFTSTKDLLDKRKEQEILKSVEQKEIERFEQNLDEHRNRRNSIAGNLEQISCKSAEIMRFLEEARNKSIGIDNELSALTIRKDEINSSIVSLDEQINEVKSTLQNARTEHALSGERKNNIAAQLLQLKAEIREQKETVVKRKRELSQIIVDREKLERELVEIQELIETRAQELAVCTERHHEREKELEELHNNVKQWQLDSQKLQRDRNEMENDVNDIKVKNAELKTQFEYLDQQAREKFRVGLSDLRALVVSSEKTGDELQEELTNMRQKLDRIGPINPQALEDYERQEERHRFLTQQQQDLIEAKESLEKTIKTIDVTCERLFNDAFAEIRQNFIEIFRRLFGGGRAELNLLESPDPMEAGIEIVAQPPGKKLSHISLLSGGERALTAISLMFALFLRKPSPFCILDEIDAPLDDSNVELLKALLKEFIHDVQFIIVTHNKRTMMLGNTIYGVTMEEPGVSKIISLAMEEIDSKIRLE